MNQEKIIQLLIKINRVIYSCYQGLIDLELLENKKERVDDFKDFYQKIREYRLLEDEMFDKLTSLCVTNEQVNEVYDYFSLVYQLIDEPFLLSSYIQYSGYNMAAMRLFERVKSEIVVPPEVILTNENDDDFNILTKKNDSPPDIDLFSTGEDDVLIMLINDEDVIGLIHKIDTQLLLNRGSDLNSISKKRLYQFKYDLFFLNRRFESMLIDDGLILSPSLVDAKKLASLKFDFNDERVERGYDEIREAEILKMVEQISQKKNQGNYSVQNKLRYIVIDFWFESISDFKLFDIMGKIEDKMKSSYNEEIEEERANVYHELYSKYGERISEYEVVEMSEEEIYAEINSSELEKQKIKKL